MVMQCDEEPPPSGGDDAATPPFANAPNAGDEQNAVLLVPTDFTDESGYALRHAQRIGRSMGLPIVLMHVLEGDERESTALERMNEQADDVCGRASDDIIMRIEHGQVSERVTNTAVEVGAKYIVLGSRDVKIPNQHKRSTSLKLLGYGQVPYITVQQPTSVRSYDNIVFPIDYTDEVQNQYDWLDRLCYYFSPTFHLLRPAVNELELEEQVDEGIANAMSILSQRGVPYTVRTMPGEADYAIEILQATREIEADLIVVITSIDPRKKGRYMLEPHERRLVLEAREIPVMVVNPS